MTDKEQIIIDGVQFNKFGDFFIDYDFNGKFQSISSSAKEYKILKSLIEQLECKTQECKELRQMYKSMVELCEAKDEAILEKQADIEELKKEAKRISANYIKDEVRYRKALDEIEKLAIKTNRDLCNNCGWVNTISCIPSEYICGDIKQILDIINKAKGEE